MNIWTTRNIKGDLARRGFSLMRAADLRMSDEMMQDWLSLSIDFASLPRDDYLPGGGKYRFRRYGRLRFSPGSGELSRLPHEDYYQSSDINRVTGGVTRKIAPLLDTTFDNAFLHELIRFDFGQFPLTGPMLREPWEVQVHLNRVKADGKVHGQPMPEGIHRDGAHFVTVHLAELVNAQGGEVSIYDDDRQLLTQFRLKQVFDSYLFNDAALWHAVSPLRPFDPAHGAVRSSLTFAFHFPPTTDL